MQPMMVSVLISLLFFYHTSAVLSISIVSDPPGPVYQTASLINFTCVVDEQTPEDSLTYQWFRWCSESDTYTLLQEENLPYLQFLSTPLECFDGVLCNVTYTNENNIISIESGFLSLKNRTGVGITIDGKQVFNSSTIITDTTDSFSTLHCYSAAYSSSSNSSPYWILPNGEIILHSTQQYNIVRSDSKSQMLLYTSLSVKENSTYMKGLYECVIHDEHQISQVLHVWVFDKEFKGTPKLTEHYSFSADGILQTLCVFQGAPGTIKWYHNDSPIPETGSIYNIDVHIANFTSLVYIGVLLDERSTDFVGDYKCVFQAHFVSEKNGWTTESVSSSFYFIAQPLGRHYDVQCPIVDEDNALVWATRDKEELISPRYEAQSRLRIEFSPIKDTDHNRLFGCHSNTSKNNYTLTFTIVGLAPQNALTVTFPSPPIARSGEPTTLKCTSTKTNLGFTNAPSIFWLGPTHDILANITNAVNNSQISSLVFFEHLKTSDAGHYTCVSSLDSQILRSPLLMSVEQILAVKLAEPVVSLTSNSSLTSTTPLKLYTASAALLICKAKISPYIDTTLNTSTTWFINGTEYTNETDNARIIKSSMVSDLVYESHLVVAVVYPALLGDSVGCRVNLLHNPDEDHYLVDADATANVPISYAEPELSVTVSPIQQSVLDQPPYSAFTITCTVQEPDYLALKPSVRWTLNGEPLMLINGLHMSEHLTESGRTEYSLKIDQDIIPGDYEYACEGLLTLPNGEDLVYKALATVTVKGPTRPFPPSDIIVAAKTSQQVTITWLVSIVTYTPETYEVQYGLEEDALVDFSIVSGSGELETRYQMYNLTLNGLLPNTTYYYRLLTTNNHSTIATNIFTFSTPENPISIGILPTLPVPAGSEQSLTCSVILSNSSLGSPMVKWISPDNKDIAVNTSERIIQPPLIIDDVTKVTIIFPMVRTSQAGLYSCKATIDNQEMALAQQYLIVQIPEPTLLDSVLPMNQHGIYMGHDVNLTCAIIHLTPFVDTIVNITFSWTHNDAELVSDQKRISIINDPTRSTLLISSVNQNFSGEYKCDVSIEDVNSQSGAVGMIAAEYVILPATISRVIQIAIQDLPEHNITITHQGKSTAGKPLRFICSVMSLDPLMDTLTLQLTGPMGEMRNSTFTKPLMSDNLTMTVELNPLKASDGGIYTCSATSDLFALGLKKKSYRESHLIVSLPPPSLEISISPSSAPHYAGTSLNITCRTLLIPEIDVPMLIIPDWSKDDMLLPNTTRISVNEPVSPSSNDHISVLMFDTLSGAVDSGHYQCLILVSTKPISPYVYPSPAVNISAELVVHTPPLSVDLLPSAVTISDVAPYNNFSLICQIRSDPKVKSPTIFTWKMLKKGSGTLANLVTNSTIDSSIHDSSFGDGISKSFLSSHLEAAGNYIFICEGSIDILEDTGPSGYSETSVTVKGPASPIGVNKINAERGSSVDSVWVYWSVDEIVYTPEEYIIHYGRQKNNLESFTNPLFSGNSPDHKHHEYQYLLENLDVGKQYYYKLVARNVLGTTESEIYQFKAGFSSSLFVLRLNGVPNCQEWIFSNSAEKIMDVSTGISDIIESLCNCGFMVDQITDGQFVCDDMDVSEVVFSGVVYQTMYNSSEELVEYLTDWAASSSSSLVVMGARLNVLEACATESIHALHCSLPTSSVKHDGLSRDLLYIIVGVAAAVLFAVICFVIVVCVVCRFHQKAKRSQEENIIMREILRASSVPLSPIHQVSDEKTEHYMSPKPFPAARYPQTPPPHYMSPRSDVFEKPSSKQQHKPTKERDSHIYYLNTPPRTLPYLPPGQTVDPVYEPIPGADDSSYQSPTKVLPPEVPKRPPTRKRTASRNSLADKLSVGTSTSRDSIDGATDQNQQKKTEDSCDYVEMNSADFGSATI